MTADNEVRFWADYWNGGVFLLAGTDDELGVGGAPSPRLYYDWGAEQWRETAEYREFREAVIEPAARAAWHRLGAQFLAEVKPKHSEHLPDHGEYALAQWGPPKGDPDHAG